MQTFDYDIAFARAGVPELENYLLSKEVYWPINLAAPAGMPGYPRFTLGWLLLALQRYSALALTPAQSAVLNSLEQEVYVISQRWRHAWEAKATQEFKARLTLWTNYLNDYREDPENQAGRYAYEVQRRVMLSLLLPFARPHQAQTDLLKALDTLVLAMLVPGPFTWDRGYEPSFPREPFWYLYGVLKSE